MRPLIALFSLLMALLSVAALAAADAPSPAPSPSPRDTDPITRRRAEEALAVHAATATKADSTADLNLLDRFAAVVAMIQEGDGFVAKDLAVEAGERYLAAGEKIKTFTAEERQILGARWATLQNSFTALGRILADSSGLEKAAAAAAIDPAPKQ